MSLSLKRTLALLLLIAALIVALFGSLARIEAARNVLPAFHSSAHSGHLLAWYCPAPPMGC